MKIFIELAIIFLITLLGEIISSLLPIAIPSSIIALVLLLLMLLLKIVKTNNIEKSGNFLLNNMAIFFVPACVSIIDHLETLKNAWWQIIAISVVSFFLTFLVSGYTVIAVKRLMDRRRCK